MNNQGFMNQLSVLFAPAIALLNRFKYAPKFIGIGILLLAPLAVQYRLQSKGAQYQETFNYKEVVGTNFLKDMRDVFVGVQKHKLFTVAGLLGEASRQDIDNSTKQVSDAVTRLDSFTELPRMDDDGRIAKGWADSKELWEKVKAHNFSNIDDAMREHDKLIDLLNQVITDVGNYSELTLDPDADSYWLQDAYVGRLPALADAVTRAATRAIVPGDVNSDRIVDLSGLHRIVLDNVAGTESNNLTNAYDYYDKEAKKGTDGAKAANKVQGQLNQQLSTSFKQLKDLVNDGQEQYRRLYLTQLSGKTPTTGNHETVERAKAALDATAAFHAAIEQPLRALANARVIKYRTERRLGGVAAVFAAMLLAYIFVALYLSVQQSVNSLGRATQRMIAGTSERFQLATQDELGQIADSYNQINAALVEARTLRAQNEPARPPEENHARTALVFRTPQLLAACLIDRMEAVIAVGRGNFSPRQGDEHAAVAGFLEVDVRNAQVVTVLDAGELTRRFEQLKFRQGG